MRETLDAESVGLLGRPAGRFDGCQLLFSPTLTYLKPSARLRNLRAFSTVSINSVAQVAEVIIAVLVNAVHALHGFGERPPDLRIVTHCSAVLENDSARRISHMPMVADGCGKV